MAASSERPRPKPRVALVALGCRVSRGDADAVASALGDRVAIARDGERADVVVVNACTITGGRRRRGAAGDPARRARASGRAHRRCRLLRGAATRRARGAARGRGGRRGARAGGGRGDGRAARRPRRAATGRTAGWGEAPLVLARHTRPFLKIQDGCDARCSYCVVPLARGGSRSLPFDEALRRLSLLGGRNAEVVLTGVHLGAYGRDLAPRRTLADLVRAAVAGGLRARLRLSSIEPLGAPARPPRATRTSRPRSVRTSTCRSRAARIVSSPRCAGPTARPDIATSSLAAARRLPGACVGADVLTGFPGRARGRPPRHGRARRGAPALVPARLPVLAPARHGGCGAAGGRARGGRAGARGRAASPSPSAAGARSSTGSEAGRSRSSSSG